MKNTGYFRRGFVDQYERKDWSGLFLDKHGSMLRQIAGRTIGVTLWACLVVLIDHHQQTRFASSIRINIFGHTVIGGFLSLLIVFRTNSCYDRWWEGRRQWGTITNEIRNLTRGASVWLRGDPVLLKKTLQWTIELPWAIMHTLRGTKWQGPRDHQPDSILDDVEVEQVARSVHVPLAVARKVSGLLAEAQRKQLISDYVMMQIDQNVQILIDACGACERIRRTPLPYAYVMHLRRALMIYMVTLPFGLLSNFGWETIPATLVIGYILFGVEEIGVEIEEPFGVEPNDLPLDVYCHNMFKVVNDVIVSSVPPDPHPAATPQAVSQT